MHCICVSYQYKQLCYAKICEGRNVQRRINVKIDSNDRRR